MLPLHTGRVEQFHWLPRQSSTLPDIWVITTSVPVAPPQCLDYPRGTAGPRALLSKPEDLRVSLQIAVSRQGNRKERPVPASHSWLQEHFVL